MHKFRISDKLEGILVKLSRKDKSFYEQIKRKMNEIINSYSIAHYKNLKYNMKDFKRVHIGHFVLVFQYDKSSDTINFDDFDHHDNIYKGRY